VSTRSQGGNKLREIVTDQPGQRLLLLGNDAIARGAIEAGVEVVAAYPGTPSSEVVETLSQVAEDVGFYAEWSVNEKVSFELVAGAALTGARSLAVMKGAGLNVIMDMFLTLPYTGTRGGMVIVVADDPGAHYSSNEQDSRFAARWAGLPCLEPESHQEAKEMVKTGFSLSERTELPVMVRTGTRLSHSTGVVEIGPLERSDLALGFNKHWKHPYRWNVYGPPGAVEKHAWLLDRMPVLQGEAESSPFNTLREGGGTTGVVACGMGAAYAREAIRGFGMQDELWFYKLGTVTPIPEQLSLEMLRSCERVLVLEDGDAFVEEQLRELAQLNHLDVEIIGQQSGGPVPRYGELNAERACRALAEVVDLPLGVDESRRQAKEDVSSLVIPRSSALCAGCPHLGTYWALRQVVGRGKDKTPVVNGDIGCYEQAGYGVKGGMPSPGAEASAKYDSEVVYDFLDTLYVMGSGVSMAQGQVRAGHDPGQVIAVAGDSTFFHTCMPGLLNAVWNQTKLTFVVMDNSWTAMTGHQACPVTGVDARGREAPVVAIEEVAQSLGVGLVKVVDAYDLDETEQAIKEALDFDGVSVVVSRRECTLQVLRRNQKLGKRVLVTEDCIGCGQCVELGCPAITFEDDQAGIDSLLCVGCGICLQVCPTSAIIEESEA
jgi:indolepyruvate ferredoxin oxidoreductase alpha subunit